ncbi:hypothetical protein [Noviherbaspirillum aerium]|uniref:hypothetical protein n=1 Tax=Noviherbaspirillum aerium TaxID=2588497 RepID=UPI00124C9C43|nr:hypothetical protein [Noviherbaspirillum aerium]
MAMLHTVWRSIYQQILRSAPAADVGPAVGDISSESARSDVYGRRSGFLVFYESIKAYLLQTQRKNAQAWQDALQRERRAKRRSLCLLLRLLNGEQRLEFRRTRQFHVIGASTGVRYRIRVDPFSNIDVLYPNGTVKHHLCVHPTGEITVYDKMAAQLLYLQDPCTEIRLLQMANVLPPRAGHYLPCSSVTRH